MVFSHGARFACSWHHQIKKSADRCLASLRSRLLSFPSRPAVQRHFSSNASTTSDVTTRHHGDSYALLIDGDCQGPRQIQAALQALRKRGRVVHAEVFAVAQRKQEKQLASLLKSEGVVFKDVPRKAGGTKGPNDIEIAMRAIDLYHRQSVACVVLLVTDVDFCLVVQRLTSQGQRAAVLLEEDRTHLAQAFREVNAEVILVNEDSFKSGRPLKMAVLHPDGSGSIQSMNAGRLAQMDAPICIADAAARLTELGFLEDKMNPPVPAIAKFWHSNSLGSLAVWPPRLAYHDFQSLDRCQKRHDWCRYTKEYCFVIPHDNARPAKCKSVIDQFGSGKCYAIASGGGPFMLRDSPDLPEIVLGRLGYLDQELNTDFDEALLLFASLAYNKRYLAQANVELVKSACPMVRRQLFRSLMLSGKTYGTWSTAPRDTMRRALTAKGLLHSTATSPIEVFEAMTTYAKVHNIQLAKNYNSLAYNIKKHWMPSQQTSR